VAFTQQMIEEMAAWCLRNPELAEARRTAWEELFAERDPRPIQCWGGAAEKSSRERRFLGYFMFDYALPDGEKPAVLAARALYSGSTREEVLRALAGTRYVLAVVGSIIRRSIYLKLGDESFEVRNSQLATNLRPGLAVVAHLVPERHGHWLLGPGWMVWPFEFGPGIRGVLASWQLGPIDVERLIQGRRTAKGEREEAPTRRPLPVEDDTLTAAVARMTEWARAHGCERLVRSEAEWQRLTFKHMQGTEGVKFYQTVIGLAGELASEDDLRELMGLANNIWNNTPQPDRGGLSPNQIVRRQADKG